MKNILSGGWGAVLMLGMAASVQGAEFFLRAAPVTNALPNNGGRMAQWGFARDTGFASRDGAVTVPGPVLTVPPGDTVLTIHLDNDLPEPVSLVIPGQPLATGQAPVRNGAGRAVAYALETAPGNNAPVDYVWTGIRPGTYLYHSGSHPAVQCSMGLYGAVIQDYQPGQAYSNVVYDRAVLLFYSEIEPRLTQAVSHDNFGPGRMVSSTMDYQAGYYLLNGEDRTNGVWTTAAADGERVLFRMINAGSRLRMPVLANAYGQIVAEDGFPYAFRKWQYSVMLPPRKTVDVLVANPALPALTWYDRRAVSNPPKPLDSNANGLPDAWEETWFGGYTNGVPDADADGDGFSNLQEYVADTKPLDGQSYVRIAGIAVNGGGKQVQVGDTSAGRSYRLFSRNQLLPGGGPWEPATGLEPGADNVTTLTDTNTPPGRVRVYKVEVDLP